ncbi:MAG: UvrB/UvrC motif-containing protein [Planctomycetaceae bacterium]|jgi:protein arginine kinase activator|nr:UvrB/UvrC motif-containing protein [Planctomycetaceae bacterium]
MKCEKCNHPATFHITELTGAEPAERHFCETHAREYLNESSQHGQAAGNLAAALSEGIPKQVSAKKAAAELKELDQQTCPVCGISFYDFRSTGRLGCSNDYIYFNKQIDALLMNIHGSRQHIGKHPQRVVPDVDRQTLLIKLRRDLDESVRCEDYERAAVLRNKIRELEK